MQPSGAHRPAVLCAGSTSGRQRLGDPLDRHRPRDVQPLASRRYGCSTAGSPLAHGAGDPVLPIAQGARHGAEAGLSVNAEVVADAAPSALRATASTATRAPAHAPALVRPSQPRPGVDLVQRGEVGCRDRLGRTPRRRSTRTGKDIRAGSCTRRPPARPVARVGRRREVAAPARPPATAAPRGPTTGPPPHGPQGVQRVPAGRAGQAGLSARRGARRSRSPSAGRRPPSRPSHRRR